MQTTCVEGERLVAAALELLTSFGPRPRWLVGPRQEKRLAVCLERFQIAREWAERTIADLGEEL